MATELTTRVSPEPLERIGAGCCGSVWASSSPHATMALKREDGGPNRSLENELRMHQRVLKASQPSPSRDFSIPLCHGFIRDSQDWDEILPRLPSGSTACNALVSEKVLPISERGRQVLVQRYCPEHAQEGVLRDPKNTHCLVRLYLGRRRRDPTRRSRFFSLRNFPLHVDQAEELGLSTEKWAISMAKALSFLYWEARVDANDVEFVLGLPRADNSNGNGAELSILGSHSLWVIDFDCCRELPMNEEGVEMAVQAFWRNDPFYPRPKSGQERLWHVFRDNFLAASAVALQNESSDRQRLPQLLMNRIVDTIGVFDKCVGEAASLEQALRDNLRLENRLDIAAKADTPEACLQRMLSVKSVISTSSSFAERQQAAVGTTACFREIGTGSIGKVFEHPGTTFVYKLPVSDQPSKLWNNYIMHKRVQSSFQNLPYLEGQVEIPGCHWYSTPTTDAFWDEFLNRFPDTPEFPRKRRHVLCMERIFPLPRPVRHALIEKYCPIIAQEKMKDSEANKDCLIRPCLGRLKYGSSGQFFSLRNFKLHSNQIQELQLEVSELETAMGHALAVVHWHTKIDAKDVEFVLGSSPVEEQKIRTDVDINTIQSKNPTSTFEQVTHSAINFGKRITSLWMLDFDDCENISMDEQGVNLAVRAFLETNFYCPKPNTGDPFIETTWVTFREKYLFFSAHILETITQRPDLSNLPRMFIEKLENQTEDEPPGKVLGGGAGSGENLFREVRDKIQIIGESKEERPASKRHQ
ncbi:hypothetical protein AK830_g969 [Neonectria ditissima]|uniref:DUF3669 domain-containing protein n=1 Tax=Neonectria ditissima TaxID=78410 RepID=A0A0P7BFW6_9HYPO|nr:hypothetical protein AK830_g969 [Neonectria ditissima]